MTHASAADGSVVRLGSSAAREPWVEPQPYQPGAAQRERGSSGKAQWPKPKPKVSMLWHSLPSSFTSLTSSRTSDSRSTRVSLRRPPLASIAKNSARSRAEPTSELQPHESDVGPPAVSCHSSVASVASGFGGSA